MAETALQRSFRERLARLRTGTTARVIAADTADTSEFVARVVPIVLNAQEVTVRETDVYMSTEAGLATRTSTRPWGLDPSQLIGRRARRGTFLEDVYGRNHRANEGTFVGRMTREVNTDVTLANRGAAFVHTAGDERISGYRRTLGAGKNCALCVAAATRTYNRGDLQPIHSHCRCGLQPIYRKVDEWTKPTNDLLRSLYERAGGNDYASLRRVQVARSELEGVDVVFSDLGPTLTKVAAA